jgi:hypothetical protein
MPNDTSIQPATAVSANGSGAVDERTPQIASMTTAPGHASSPVPNPVLLLDPALSMVVIEFRNSAGAVTNTIPSQRQIEAYRMWQDSRVGPAPALD